MMTRIFNLKSPEEIGLTNDDLEKRIVIATGFCAEELLPPYNTTYHKEKAIKVLSYLKTRKHIDYDSIADITRKLRRGTKIAEVVGAETSFCVELAARDLIKKRIWAYVNPELIFISSKTYPSFTNGRVLLQEFFFGDKKQERICYKINGIFILGSSNPNWARSS